MRFYADENFPLGVVEELRRLGHDVLTAYEDGKANQSVSDEDILARATALACVVLTLDRVDFKRLHLQHPEYSGIVICTEDPDRLGQAQRISNALQGASQIPGQLVRVYRRP